MLRDAAFQSDTSIQQAGATGSTNSWDFTERGHRQRIHYADNGLEQTAGVALSREELRPPLRLPHQGDAGAEPANPLYLMASRQASPPAWNCRSKERLMQAACFARVALAVFWAFTAPSTDGSFTCTIVSKEPFFRLQNMGEKPNSRIKMQDITFDLLWVRVPPRVPYLPLRLSCRVSYLDAAMKPLKKHSELQWKPKSWWGA